MNVTTEDFETLLFNLKSKITQSINLLKEVNSLISQAKQNNSIENLKTLIKQLENNISNIERLNIEVPDEMRDLKSKFIARLSQHEELNKAIQDFSKSAMDLICLYSTENSVKSSFLSTRRIVSPNVPSTLSEIIEVVKLVWFDKHSFSVAVARVAKNRNIAEPTVRDKCTRRISLNTYQFCSLLDNKEKMIKFLLDNFSQYSDFIKKELL